MPDTMEPHEIRWDKLAEEKEFDIQHEGSGVGQRTFVFFDGEPREVILIEQGEDEKLYHLRPTEKCPSKSCVPESDVHVLSNDDKLLLCPERILSDEELQEALRVAATARTVESDKPAARAKRKKTERAKGPELEMDAEMMSLLGLDKLAALVSEGSDNEEPTKET